MIVNQVTSDGRRVAFALHGSAPEEIRRVRSINRAPRLEMQGGRTMGIPVVWTPDSAQVWEDLGLHEAIDDDPDSANPDMVALRVEDVVDNASRRVIRRVIRRNGADFALSADRWAQVFGRLPEAQKTALAAATRAELTSPPDRPGGATDAYRAAEYLVRADTVELQKVVRAIETLLSVTLSPAQRASLQSEWVAKAIAG